MEGADWFGAIQQGQTEMVTALLDRNVVDIHMRDQTGKSALMCAAAKGHRLLFCPLH